MKHNSNFNNIYIVFIFVSLLYVLMCSFFWNNFPMSESTNFWELVINSFEDVVNNNWHPPFYIILLYIAKIIFKSYIGGYVVGIVSVIISIILIYKIINRNNIIIKDIKALWILLFSYISMPIIINGTFIFDIDNTILTPAILFLYLSYLKYTFNNSIKNLIIFILSIVISLWCKMSTPVFLIMSLIIFHLMIFDYSFLFKRLLPIVLVSIGSFYITYGYLYTKYILNDYGSFELSSERTSLLISGANTFQLPINQIVFSLGSNLIALILWTSPILILTILYISIGTNENIRIIYKWQVNKFEKQYLIPIIFIIITIISYTFILKLQASAGFPKYHYPIFAFLFIIIGIKLKTLTLRLKIFDLIFLGLTFFIYVYLIEDVLLKTYELGRGKKIFEFVVFYLKTNIIYFFPLFLYFFIKKFIFKYTSNLIITSLIFIIIINISGFIYRAKGDYSTNYHYGIRGTSQALEFANRIPMEKSVFLPFLGLFLKKQPGIYNFANGRLKGTDRFIANTDYLIITDHLLYTNKFFFGSKYVEKNYKRIDTIKSYGIWEKK